MNKITIAAAAGAATVMLAGCSPDLAQVKYGEKEEQWQRVIRDNYSGYEAPRTAPPAIADSVSPRLLEEERLRQSEKSDAPAATADAPSPSDDPEVMVDRAAEKPESKADAAPAKSEAAPAKSEAAPAKSETAPAEKDAPAANTDKAAAADKKAAPAVAGDEYIVKSGDTLGKIAQKFYGDARRSDVLIKANPAIAGNPDVLRIGMKLVIPKI